MSLKGKVVVVTGSNVGIGLETAVGVAAQGATTVLACRNQDKAEAAAKEVTRAPGTTTSTWWRSTWPTWSRWPRRPMTFWAAGRASTCWSITPAGHGRRARRRLKGSSTPSA